MALEEMEGWGGGGSTDGLTTSDVLRMRVRLVTPAFLGDARQEGAWRSAPFKSLLRQWWRIAVARECGYDHKLVREREGRLFGHAWLQEKGQAWASRSRVLMRLGKWTKGTLERWPPDPRVRHDEVRRDVGAHLYLGYGPLKFERGTILKASRALAAGETISLLLLTPPEHREEVVRALQLMAWFGAVGGRSRNGWGSLELLADRGGHLALRPFDAIWERAGRPDLGWCSPVPGRTACAWSGLTPWVPGPMVPPWSGARSKITPVGVRPCANWPE